MKLQVIVIVDKPVIVFYLFHMQLLQDCLSVEGRPLWPPMNRIHRHAFCYCDLDLDPMTLMYELDLDFLKTTCLPKMNFLEQGFQKLDCHRQKQQKTLQHRI